MAQSPSSQPLGSQSLCSQSSRSQPSCPLCAAILGKPLYHRGKPLYHGGKVSVVESPDPGGYDKRLLVVPHTHMRSGEESPVLREFTRGFTRGFVSAFCQIHGYIPVKTEIGEGDHWHIRVCLMKKRRRKGVGGKTT